MKLTAIIVEDEETSRDILKNYLKKYCPSVTVLGEASNIEEALILIRNSDLDLVFLDVEMPYGNAFDLLDKVGDVNFETVFVTAYNHYAMDALNAHASYYLMKPIDIDELIKNKTVKEYFIHGLGHWLGLDVHDVGDYHSNDKRAQLRPFEVGMVMTIEPGLYMPLDDTELDAQWRGIGIRIEDNIVVTEQGYENLTADCPETINDIEALMAR